MSAHKGKNFLKKIFPLILILLIIGGFLVWYLKFRPIWFARRELVKPSEDQQELIKEFGYPNTFTLAMMDNVRYENWNYYQLTRSFVFLNGVFIEDQVIPRLEGDYQFPEFKPTQFVENMTLADIENTLGSPTIEAEVSENLLENSKIYDFWDQVKVGTKEDKIVYVETLPVFIPKEFQVKNEKE